MKNLFVIMAVVTITLTTNAAAQTYLGNLNANPYYANSVATLTDPMAASIRLVA